MVIEHWYKYRNQLSIALEFPNYINNTYPILDIGSGTGWLTQHLSKYHHVIPIDINPNYFNNKVIVWPEYDTCINYFKNNPNSVGKCNMLIAWPCFNNYDITSILLGKPIMIAIVYYKNIACSTELFDFIEKTKLGLTNYTVIKYQNYLSYEAIILASIIKDMHT